MPTFCVARSSLFWSGHVLRAGLVSYAHLRSFRDAANLHTKILDFGGFDSSIVLSLRNSHVHRKFPRSVESRNLSRDDLSSVLVGRLGASYTHVLSFCDVVLITGPCAQAFPRACHPPRGRAVPGTECRDPSPARSRMRGCCRRAACFLFKCYLSSPSLPLSLSLSVSVSVPVLICVYIYIYMYIYIYIYTYMYS